MFNQLDWNRAYLIETLEPDTVFFKSERESICVQNPLYYRLVSAIDGQRNMDEIIDFLQLELLQNQQDNQNDPHFFQTVLNYSISIQQAIFQLHQQGYLVEKQELLPPELEILCHHLQIAQPSQAVERLRSIKVTVKILSDAIASQDFIDSLNSLHITQVPDDGDLTIILTDDYLHPDLEEWNQQALTSEKPWLLVNPLGSIGWIGPLFYPHQTGCWHCLAQRLRDNRPIEEFISRKKQDKISLTSPLGFSASTVKTILNMTAMEVFKWIVQGENQYLQGKLITYDSLSLQFKKHTLTKRPQCPSCGYMINPNPLPVVLGHRKKAFTSDGGHRFCSPQKTLANYQEHISPITGIVRELNKIQRNSLAHTYIAKHHFRSIFDDVKSLQQNIEGISAGKGRTDIQAQASGFCEAIERYSGVFQGNEITHKASYQELLDKANAQSQTDLESSFETSEYKPIHPHQCLNFSQKQYQNRDQWNVNCQGWFQKIPLPFDQNRIIDWTPVWSLTEQNFKYLPTVYCYYGYPQPQPLDCWADSNGCAAGNTIEEAILQGFMELVERDAVALWWYNRLVKPAVDLDSFDEPYFDQLRQYYQKLNRDLWVIDITSDFNIPCFAAISSRKDTEVEDILLGYGAHFDPKIAISRALTEVNQILPNVSSFDQNGTTIYPPSADPLGLEWWQSAKLSNQPYLIPDTKLTAKKISDYSLLASDDLFDDVKLCQQIVEEQGMEMLVLDQTRVDIGLRVAKVIVPGMLHMWMRLGGQRLYDVPVKMGWLKKALNEEQLNPFPMWM